jgi:hypothetical protein
MKKIVSLVLVAMLVLSLAPMAFAAPGAAKAYGFSKYVAKNTEAYDLGTTYTNVTSISIPLLKSGAAADYTVATKTDKLSLGYRATGGVISGVTLEKTAADGTAYVKIAFKAYTGTTAAKYTLDLYFNVDGARDVDSNTSFKGEYKNDEWEVSGGSYAWLDNDKPVLSAKAYVKSLEVDVDKGITLTTKVFNGKKYYAKITDTMIDSEEDDGYVTEYPDIYAVYELEANGWSSSTTVKLNKEPADVYVYTVNDDDELEYVGENDGELPVLSIYYVSETDLDLGVDEEGDAPVDGEPTGDGFETPVETGGDDAPANINDNPGTGC